MPFPQRSRIELPILQELKATGGEEQISVLCKRLLAYFPQISEEDLRARTPQGRNKWRLLVYRAGQALARAGELERSNGLWRLTPKGHQRAEAEGMRIELVEDSHPKAVSHDEIKKKLVQIGQMLGKYAQEEHQRYDVVWRDSELSPRISHVFEVQNKGKLESALAKLKHAYDTQRSKPYLVIADERDAHKASKLLRPYLTGSFHEIGSVTTIMTVEDIERLHRALSSVGGALRKLFE